MTLTPTEQRVYKEFYTKKVFVLEDAKLFLKNYRAAIHAVKGLAEKKYIKKVKRGLYCIIPFEQTPDNNDSFVPDKYLIGDNFMDKCFLSHHSALELYNATEKGMNKVFISSNNRVPNVGYKKVNYNVIKTKHFFGFEDINYNNNLIKISDKERTILDCLRNINYTLGFDELKDAIVKLKPIDFEKCFQYLKKINETSLYSRAGYTFDLLRSELSVPGWFLDKIKSNLTNRTYYLDISKKGSSRHIKEWKLMVPL
ncbi:hypothetical protein HQ529_05650 [Candidatus Woesearchaeota archaeon]|nr:hypothetical protein [Candidatus Woesearchaeota archaeon]